MLPFAELVFIKSDDLNLIAFLLCVMTMLKAIECVTNFFKG